MRELFRAINDAPAESFRDDVGMHLDLAATLRFVAADVLLGEADGILGFAGMHNFYLHRHSTTQRHQFLPWDKDYALFQWNYPVVEATSANILTRRALEDPELRSLYAGFLLEAVASATAAGWLEHEAQRAYRADSRSGTCRYAQAVHERGVRGGSGRGHRSGKAAARLRPRRSPAAVWRTIAGD